MKKWYESKTLWFALLTIVVGVAGGFGFAGFELEPEVAVLAQAVITIIVGAVNAYLRWKTDKGLTL